MTLLIVTLAVATSSCSTRSYVEKNQSNQCTEGIKEVQVDGVYSFPASQEEEEVIIHARQRAMREALLKAGSGMLRARQQHRQRLDSAGYEDEYGEVTAISVQGYIKHMNFQQFDLQRTGDVWRVLVSGKASVCPQGSADLPTFLGIGRSGDLGPTTVRAAVQRALSLSATPLVLTVEQPTTTSHDIVFEVTDVEAYEQHVRVGSQRARVATVSVSAILRDFVTGVALAQRETETAVLRPGEMLDGRTIDALAFYAVERAAEQLLRRWRQHFARAQQTSQP